MELVLIRHGLPLRVETEDGAPADPPLAPLGHQQAIKLADFLAVEPLNAIYSSPLRRAWQTAAPLAERLALPVAVDPGIAEFDAEAASYIPMEELKRLDYERWKAYVNGGHQEPDAFAAFCQRVVTSIEGIIERHRGEKVALVCHGGVINVWAAHVIGFQPRLFFAAEYCSINRFMAASSGERSVLCLNLATHLGV